jgi:membrane-associated protease RseP (regulator of RpoE activity)
MRSHSRLVSAPALALVAILVGLFDLAAARPAAAFPPGPPRLGLEVQGLTPELRKFLDAPEDAGVLVARVEPDSPAAQAGLAAGDVLVEAGGEKLTSPHELTWIALRAPEGEKLKLVFYRKGERKELELVPRGERIVPPWDRDDLWGPSQAPMIRELREQLRALERRMEQLERKLEQGEPNRT